MYHEALAVGLIIRKDGISPNPPHNPDWDELYSLRWHLGCSYVYLQHQCGPVEAPKIQIAVRNGMYAILVNGSGAYREYKDAWTYINAVFDGMEAVYADKSYDVKADIPVMFNFENGWPKGKALIKQGERTTELVIRVDEHMPLEIFDGLLGVSFAYTLRPKDD